MYASTNIIYQYAFLAKPKYYTVARMDLQKIPLLPLLSLSFKKLIERASVSSNERKPRMQRKSKGEGSMAHSICTEPQCLSYLLLHLRTAHSGTKTIYGLETSS